MARILHPASKWLAFGFGPSVCVLCVCFVFIGEVVVWSKWVAVASALESVLWLQVFSDFPEILNLSHELVLKRLSWVFAPRARSKP